jgi:NitT/TauT family transport system substrate-binding protein
MRTASLSTCLIIVTVGLFALVACASAAKPAGSMDKLTFVYSSVSAASATWWVVKESGSWAKYGIDVDLKFIDTGNLFVQALIGGSVNIGSASAQDVMTAIAAGNKDLVILSLNTERLTDVLVVTPDINSPEDLKGKKVGVSRIGSEGDFTMIQSLKVLGLDPAKDVTRLQIGTEGPRLAALKSGAISAGALDAAQEPEIQSLGLRILVRLSDLDLPWAKQGVYTRRSFVEQNRDLMVRFMKGYLEGIAFYKNPQNREQSIAFIQKYMQKDRAVVEGIYDSYSQLQAAKPYPPPAALQKTNEYSSEGNPALKDLDISTVYDDSILRELDQSGFIDALYKTQ